MKRIAILTLLAPLIGCSQTGPAIDGSAAAGCEWTAYIYVSKQDTLTDDTATQILAHNRTRQDICE